MVLNKLHLINFRNYRDQKINFHNGTNILFGNNGQGKTNIIESLYYLALTKSFRTNNDQNLILSSESFFRIQGDFTTEQGRKALSAIAFSASEGKRLTYNNQRIQKFSEYIGSIPVVLLAPSDLEVTQAGPHQRRKFLDIMLSQASKIYLHHLLQYRRSLKQRNLLLQGAVDEHLMQSWEDALVQHGTILIEKRLEAIEKLDELVKEYYMRMSGGTEKVKLIYQSTFPFKEREKIPELYHSALKQNFSKDQQNQSTSIGPHRDEVLLLINGKFLKSFGSQGEHKTFIIALKMAEYHYLQSVQKSLPLLLFDDIFGELDAGRIGNMINSLSKTGQVFITTTSPNFLGKLNDWKGQTAFYQIEQGTVKETADVWAQPNR
jgi:DNA replication and repair protein RecF